MSDMMGLFGDVYEAVVNHLSPHYRIFDLKMSWWSITMEDEVTCHGYPGITASPDFRR